LGLSALVSGAWAAGACADEIKVLAVPEMMSAFQQIIPDFVNSSSHSVVAEYVSAQAIRDRILRAEKIDVVFVTAQKWQPLIRSGKVDRATVIASFGLALGIQPAKLLPGIKGTIELKKALLAANAIGMLRPQGHADGVHEMLRRQGILQNLAPKLKYYGSAFALAAALSRGDRTWFRSDG
jgi:ABC-type molybdate transport system substrate-binding protein